MTHRMNARTTSALALVLGLATAMPATAASIYSEATDGDLDNIGSTNVDLGLGANTISGTIPATGNNNDSDRIKITQTAGLIVESIQLTFSGAWDTANIGQSLTTALFNNQANLFDDNFNTVTGSPNNSPTISAAFFDNFGPETGPLAQDVDGAIWDFQLSAGVVFPTANWMLTINTTAKPIIVDPPMGAVPLPAGLPLLLAGLGGLAFLRRRKR